MHLDPIEKKPLYHFMPGSQILSLGFIGCNLGCPFCQNYSISQRIPSFTTILPEQLFKELQAYPNSIGVAYTYSEPLIHYEYIKDCSRLLQAAGKKNVLVSNGTINNDIFNELLPYLDAANIDLKSWDADFYKKELKGNKEMVLQNIKDAAKQIHLEITSLIIPGKNDDIEEMEHIASFISEIDDAIPLHLSCYYPAYTYTIESPTKKSMLHLQKTAQKFLKHVYLGNMHLAL